VPSSALGFDLAGSARWEISLDERGLVSTVQPVWAGTRDYNGRIEFRDPAQLKTPGFLRTLKLAALMLGHPRDDEGRFIFLGATASAEGTPLPWADGQAALYPFRDHQVGSLGDEIIFEEVDGIELPTLRAVITDTQAIATVIGLAGRMPKREVSLGFVKHVIEEPGEWTHPSGDVRPYHVTQIIDPDDPRVPEDLRPWVGANYLGVGFGQGESRGGHTRLGADAEERPDDRRAPRTFFLYRQGDETGVSGLGHVLDGVVWPDGETFTKWCVPGKPSEDCRAKTFAEWRSIHVDAHPSNRSLVLFDDGGDPPSPPIEDKPPKIEQDTNTMDMTPEEMAAKIAELQAALAERDAKIAELTEKIGDDAPDEGPAEDLKAKEEELMKAQASMDAKDRELAKLHAELAPVRQAERVSAVAAVAERAGIDAKKLDGVKLDNLEVAAMKARLEAGLDGHIGESYRDNPIYLRAAFDLLKAPATSSTSGVSPAFAAAVGADGKTAAPSEPVNEFDALP